MKTIYLDYAAGTPVDPQVLSAMTPYIEGYFYNPSANYQQAQDVRKIIENARASIASQFGARANEIIFTSGGTESNNLAVRGVMERYPGKKMLYSAIEHPSVSAPAELCSSEKIAVDQQGRVALSDMQNKLGDDTVLVSIMQANNEIGTIQPIRSVGNVLKQIRADRKARGVKTPLYFHTDACQAVNYLDTSVHSLGVDLMTINGGKIYGPKQSGALFVSSHTLLSPQILGGGQQRALRSGTESVASAVGLDVAVEITARLRVLENKRLSELQNYFFHQLVEKIPTAIVHGSVKHRLPNNVSLALPGLSNERLLIQLEDEGVLAATGSACKASDPEPSNTLKSIGVDDALAGSTLRFSMGRQTVQADLDYLLKTLIKLTA